MEKAVSKSEELLESTRNERNEVQQKYETAEQNFKKAEKKCKQCVDEIGKGNAFIKKLRNDKKKNKDTIKTLNQQLELLRNNQKDSTSALLKEKEQAC